MVDPVLCGDLWVKQICKRTYALLNRFYRCGGTWLPLRARRALYEYSTLILPVIDYGGIPHTGISAANSCKLQRVQNSCLRFVYGVTRRESVVSLFSQTGGLRVRERRLWLLLTLLYKVVLKGEGPKYTTDNFILVADIHSYNKRHRSHAFMIPIPKSRALSNSFRVIAPKLWNSLPPDIYLDSNGGFVSVATFRSRLRQHLIADTV